MDFGRSTILRDRLERRRPTGQTRSFCLFRKRGPIRCRDRIAQHRARPVRSTQSAAVKQFQIAASRSGIQAGAGGYFFTRSGRKQFVHLLPRRNERQLFCSFGNCTSALGSCASFFRSRKICKRCGAPKTARRSITAGRFFFREMKQVMDENGPVGISAMALVEVIRIFESASDTL